MKRLLIVAAIVLVPVSLLAYGLRGDPRTVPSPLIGKPAPDFALDTFAGPRLGLADLRGKVVVVNFWASWCVQCAEEAAGVEATWERYRDRGVVFVGVDIQDRRQDALGFIREHGKTYPNGPDPTGSIAISYGVYGVPETFVLDGGGRIRFKQIGGSTPEILSREIDRALQGGAIS